MMNKLITTLVAALALVAGQAGAAGGDAVRFEPAPINRLDNESLQRGARTFVNYCLNCHSAKYMRYNVLTRIGLSEEQIKDNLILTGAKIADPMKVAMTYDEARNWFGAIPPDLSLESRVRGVDWLYNYFLGFYRDEKSGTGWNNLVFPNVAMPHVLWELSGTNRLVSKEYKDAHEAQGAAIAAKQLVRVVSLPGGKAAVETLAVATPGTMTPVEYRAMIADLVNYLDFMGEPMKNQRISLGLIVLIYLGVLFVFAFWLKKEFWKDVH